jgi:hypothetical protein
MKKALAAATIAVVIIVIAGVLVFRGISVGSIVSAREDETVSEKSAKSLQSKIDAIKQAHEENGRAPRASRVEISEIELESYMLFEMKDEIPARMDSFDVQLASGTVAAQTQLTFSSDATGNPLIDAVVGGTHDLFVKGGLSATGGRGKFELLEVRVDGIPVPKILIETLIDKYVKPKYPEIDIDQPFEMPWGIEDLTIDQTKVTILY